MNMEIINKYKQNLSFIIFFTASLFTLSIIFSDLANAKAENIVVREMADHHINPILKSDTINPQDTENHVRLLLNLTKESESRNTQKQKVILEKPFLTPIDKY
jgi:hypothetical protein